VAWHILASSYFDFDAIERDADADRAPRHFLRYLSQRLGAPIHQPDPPTDTSAVSIIDRIAAVLFADPSQWEMARRVRRQLAPGDVVYAAGSTVGLPLALLCSVFGPSGVEFAVTVTDVQRPRIKLLGWLLALLRTRWMVIVPHTEMAETASRGFGRFANGIMAINGLTDFDFFRPIAAGGAEADAIEHPGEAARPLIASCGTEARDYELLARATSALAVDVDVKVCFASPNLTKKTRFTVPDPMPENMEIRYFSFAELRALYRAADVVVVPLLPNRYAAGLTTVFEAVACERPVVVARSPGVVEELIGHDLVEWYAIGDVEGLRAAIERVLADPEGARSKADEAHEWVRSRHSASAYFGRIVEAVESAFGGESPDRATVEP